MSDKKVKRRDFIFTTSYALGNIQETNYKSHEVIFKGRFYKGISYSSLIIFVFFNLLFAASKYDFSFSIP